jgi:thiol-disulfide isomerase/thioredoxin
MCAFAVILGAGSCSRKQKPGPKVPVFYDETKIAKAEELSGRGYELLDKGDVKGAVEKFAEAGKLVPNGLFREYNTACAYARGGDRGEAFRWLDRFIENGGDDAERLESDSDFDSLRADPRFQEAVARARANYEARSAEIARELPEYATPPDTFATEEALKKWVGGVDRRLSMNRSFWTNAELLSARMDFLGRYLAGLRMLRAGDPAFDYRLERVRAAFNLGSVHTPGWGAVSDLIVREVDAYAQASPAAGLPEADFIAGMALSMKYPERDPRRVDAYAQADAYLAKVPMKTEYFGAARALQIADRLRSPGADEGKLGEDLRSLIDEYPGDQMLYLVVSTRMASDAVRLLWPIRIDMPDIDGKKVSLDQYRGKVLMIDFWANWCQPCRQDLPFVVEAYKEYHSKGFDVLSISLDYADMVNAEAYRDSSRVHEMKWRHIYDGRGWNTELVKRYFVSGIPAAFIVGRDGSLVAWGDDCRGARLAGTVAKALAAKGT